MAQIIKASLQEKIIEEMAKQYGWNKSKKFVVNNEGGLNQRRPLVFQSGQIFMVVKVVTKI